MIWPKSFPLLIFSGEVVSWAAEPRASQPMFSQRWVTGIWREIPLTSQGGRARLGTTQTPGPVVWLFAQRASQTLHVDPVINKVRGQWPSQIRAKPQTWVHAHCNGKWLCLDLASYLWAQQEEQERGVRSYIPNPSLTAVWLWINHLNFLGFCFLQDFFSFRDLFFFFKPGFIWC